MPHFHGNNMPLGYQGNKYQCIFSVEPNAVCIALMVPGGQRLALHAALLYHLYCPLLVVQMIEVHWICTCAPKGSLQEKRENITDLLSLMLAIH